MCVLVFLLGGSVMTLQTWNACQEYLNRLGMAEYRAGLAAHVKSGRKKSTYRHSISDYHASLVAALGRADEQQFKAIKMLSGYASAVGA